MKKLIVAASLLVGSLTAYAATNVQPVTNGVETTVVFQDYVEIQVSELPAAVTDAFKKDFENGTINKAYVNGEKVYKLDVTTEDGSVTLYANEKGEWIEG